MKNYSRKKLTVLNALEMPGQGGVGGGDSPYENDGDARRIA